MDPLTVLYVVAGAIVCYAIGKGTFLLLDHRESEWVVVTTVFGFLVPICLVVGLIIWLVHLVGSMLWPAPRAAERYRTMDDDLVGSKREDVR